MRLRLRSQLFLVLFVIVAAAAAGLTVYFTRLQRGALAATAEQKTAMLRANLREKAATLARNGAVSSARSALEMDFSFLQKVVDATVAGDKGIVYAMIVDRKGKIVVHSDRTQVRRTADVSAGSSKTETVTREVQGAGGVPILEAVAPIRLGSELWGTARYGLSLAPIQQQMAESRRQLQSLQRQAIIASVATAVGLLVLALIFAAVAARRVVRPVADLDEAVQKVLAGHSGVRVEVKSPLEVARLAAGFNSMLNAIAEREKVLRQDRLRVEGAVGEAKQAVAAKQLFLSRVSDSMLQPLDRLEKIQSALVQAFVPVSIYQCAACGTEFESEDGEAAADKRCPSCGGALTSKASARLATEPEDTARRLSDLEARGNELKKLVDDILDFSALDSGNRNLVVESLEVSALVQAARAAVAAPKGKALIWPDSAGALRLDGDRERLQQALAMEMELLCQLSRQSDVEIRLEIDPCTYRGSAGLQFVAREMGAGLAPELVEALRTGSSPDVRSTLTIMALRRVADLHAGEFSLESSVGRGTTARLVLPQRHAAPVAAKAVAAARVG